MSICLKKSMACIQCLVSAFCILRHNVMYHNLDGKTSHLNEHVCKTDGIYAKGNHILKMNYKIDMHLIDLAHIKSTSSSLSGAVSKITLGCRIVEI